MQLRVNEVIQSIIWQGRIGDSEYRLASITGGNRILLSVRVDKLSDKPEDAILYSRDKDGNMWFHLYAGDDKKWNGPVYSIGDRIGDLFDAIDGNMPR